MANIGSMGSTMIRPWVHILISRCPRSHLKHPVPIVKSYFGKVVLVIVEENQAKSMRQELGLASNDAGCLTGGRQKKHK